MCCQFMWLCLDDSAVSNAVLCNFILQAKVGPHLVHITPGFYVWNKKNQKYIV